MNRTGKIVQLCGENKVKVLIERHAACGDCGACQYGKENINMEILVVNKIGAQKGDTVEVSMEAYSILKLTFITYGIPLIMFVLGVFIGNIILKSIGVVWKIELYSMTIGLILLILGYIPLKIYENHFKKNIQNTPIISRVIE